MLPHMKKLLQKKIFAQISLAVVFSFSVFPLLANAQISTKNQLSANATPSATTIANANPLGTTAVIKINCPDNANLTSIYLPVDSSTNSSTWSFSIAVGTTTATSSQLTTTSITTASNYNWTGGVSITGINYNCEDDLWLVGRSTEAESSSNWRVLSVSNAVTDASNSLISTSGAFVTGYIGVDYPLAIIEGGEGGGGTEVDLTETVLALEQSNEILTSIFLLFFAVITAVLTFKVTTMMRRKNEYGSN